MTKKITQEDLDKVAGMSTRLAADTLGVPKSTLGDARARARENGGRLPFETPKEERGTAEGEFFKEDKAGDSGQITAQVFEDLSPDDILRKFGRNPELVRITGVLSESHWGDDANGWKHAYKFSTEYITEESNELTITDLPLLYAIVQGRTLEPLPRPSGTGRATVVVWADPQTGKRDSRGGTPELIERMARARTALSDYIATHPASEAAFLSVGDEVESFENVPSQQFLNDLSFPDQLDLELTFELEFLLDLAATHSKIQVAGTSSNHCAWRRGKDILGKPGDDYGIYLKRQLEKAVRLNTDYDHIEFVYPDEWDETNAVTVAGTKIAMAHGHQVNNPNQIGDWWKKQAFGRQASSDADVLLTGHFHHFRMEEVIGGEKGLVKPRVWIQAPTMDNGSSWVRNKWGNDSTPGLLVFQVTEGGIDFETLTML